MRLAWLVGIDFLTVLRVVDRLLMRKMSTRLLLTRHLRHLCVDGDGAIYS